VALHFENSFEVEADPDNVYGFLLDVTRIVTCVPGAELTEILEDDTFQGRMKVKVGAITTSYRGTAKILSRDDANRSATLSAQGRESAGAGAATMDAKLSVAPAGSGSVVSIATELTITGRVAQFGRGVIEDVSRRLIDQMANCIKQKIESQAEMHPEASGTAPSETGGAGPSDAGAAALARPAPAAPVNLFAILFSVLRDRVARIFRRGDRSGQAGAERER
jgi:uncharacterized protein